jgi:hypothetical protein
MYEITKLSNNCLKNKDTNLKNLYRSSFSCPASIPGSSALSQLLAGSGDVPGSGFPVGYEDQSN